MKITWFGHSCFRVETGGSVIMIDPFLKGSPTFQASGVSFEEAVKGVTHVALTHGHDDHLGDAAEICISNSATLFAVYELAMYLGSQGVTNLEPMNTGGTVKARDFELTFTNAVHSSSSNGVYLGNPCGLVIHSKEGRTLYHMGDTDVFGDMAIINELHRPHVGIVPIGDRFTMGARTAAYACKKFFAFGTIIPCHYGTFPIIDQTAEAFLAEMDGQDVIVPKIGATVNV